MADVKYITNIYKIDARIDSVYTFLSDFRRLRILFLSAGQVDAEEQPEMARKIKTISEHIEEVVFEKDFCICRVKGMGETVFRITERESPTLIKYVSAGNLPIQISIWVQLLENGPYDTRLKITVEADMNLMLKMMLKTKLEKGIESLAEQLTHVPYDFFVRTPLRDS